MTVYVEVLATAQRSAVRDCVFAGDINGPMIDWFGQEGLIADNVFNAVSAIPALAMDNEFGSIIRGNRFVGNERPISITSSGELSATQIIDNTFTGGGSVIAIEIIATVTGAITETLIANNLIANYNGGIKLDASLSAFASSVHIAGNTILNCGGWAIDVNDCHKVQVAANHLASNNDGIRVTFTGTQTSEACSVVDNFVYQGANALLFEAGGIQLMHKSQCTGNSFVSADFVTVRDFADGVYADNYHYECETLIEDSDRITIKNNVWNTIVSDVTPRTTALEVNGSDYATIEGNTIYGLRSAGPNHNAIVLGGTMTGACVRFSRYIAQSTVGSIAYDTALVIGASVSNTVAESNKFSDATTAVADAGTGSSIDAPDDLVMVGFFQGTLVVQNGVSWFVPPFDITVMGALLAASTGPTVTDVEVDLKRGPAFTTMYTGAAAQPDIPAGSNIGSEAAPDSITDVDAGVAIRFDVTQIGSGAPGANLTIMLRYRRRT